MEEKEKKKKPCHVDRFKDPPVLSMAGKIIPAAASKGKGPELRGKIKNHKQAHPVKEGTKKKKTKFAFGTPPSREIADAA